MQPHIHCVGQLKIYRRSVAPHVSRIACRARHKATQLVRLQHHKGLQIQTESEIQGVLGALFVATGLAQWIIITLCARQQSAAHVVVCC